MTEQADWAPANDPDVIEHSKSLEWLETPEAVVAGPYVPGGDDVPVQAGLESDAGADPDSTPVDSATPELDE